MQAGNVELRLVVDPRGAVAGVTKLGTTAATQGAKTERAFKEVEDQSKRTQRALEGLGDGLRKAGQGGSLMGQVFKGALGANLVESGLRGAANAAKEFIAGSYEAARQANALQQALKFAAGGAAAGREEMAFLREEAKRLGFDLQGSAQGFVSLAAAARGTRLEGQGVRDIFTAISEAGVTLRLSAEQQAGALQAVQQMISKGSVQAEELRGQLGERLPGAFQIAAKAMGVTTAQLGKMLEQGEVFADDFLPKFAKALREDFAKPAEESATTAEAAINRFANRAKLAAAGLGAVFLEAAGMAAKVGNAVLEWNDKANQGIQTARMGDVDPAVRKQQEAVKEGLRLAKEAQAQERQRAQGPTQEQQTAITKANEERAKAAKEAAKLAKQQDEERKRALESMTEFEGAEEFKRQKKVIEAARLEDQVRARNEQAEEEFLQGKADFQAQLMEKTGSSLSIQLEANKDYYNQLRKQAAEWLLDEKELAAAKVQISQAEAEQRRQIYTALAQSQTSQLAGNLRDVAGAWKSFLPMYKKAAHVQNMVDTYAGATAAYKSLAGIPVVGPGLGAAAAAAAVVAGLARGAMIERQKFAQGGIVPGNQTAGDRVPAMVNSGEMILNRAQQANLFALANGRGSSRGGDVYIGDVIIQAAPGTTPEQARAMGEAAADGIYSRLRAQKRTERQADFQGVTG